MGTSWRPDHVVEPVPDRHVGRVTELTAPVTPALTEANLYPGGVASPLLSSPQQAIEPSVFNPQVCSRPALTEENVPIGSVAWPSSLLPQQETEPPALKAQVWLPFYHPGFPQCGQGLRTTRHHSTPPWAVISRRQ